ncbi:hypothetical protein HDV03_005420 [Kappamyces sp. JEL0829]|nr:hypothetical protein HDV03_005420 [Kappamyces sp. JEL0829]
MVDIKKRKPEDIENGLNGENPLNFIDNDYLAVEKDQETLPVTNPATGAVICRVPLSTSSQVNQAVMSAKKAFEEWRVQYLIRYHQLVVKNKEKLADLIVLEHGKTREEAYGDIAKGNETVEYALSLPQLILGNVLEVSRGVTCQDIRRPHGVVASIVPFNFPFMVPHWTLPIAIATGNTMIIKPSEKVPMTMSFVMRLLKEAGLPAGVVNLVHGTAPVVQSLCDHPDVKAVTFVGTTKVAELLSHRCRQLNKRVLALGGAKNHLVAAPDCNIEMASSDIVASFSGCSGQRCMAASVLLTIGDQKELIGAVVRKAGAITPGQGGKNTMGPVIDKPSLDKILSYINDSEKGGAKILLDGRLWLKNAKLQASGGFWVGPTVILHTNKADKALHHEIFGPVISVFAVRTKEEAILVENANPYGNAACIYTSTGATADWFTKRFSAGMVGVNIGVPVPREPFSFGGINDSKFGDFDITGDGGLEFFTQRRKITTKWAPPQNADWMS